MAQARRDAPLWILAALHAFVTASGAAFHLGARPKLLATYEKAGLALPAGAKLVLTTPALPALLAVAACLGAYATFSRGKRGARLRWSAIGLTASTFGFMAAVAAVLAPLLR